MARPLRIEYKNAYYHVMNCGRDHQLIFHGEKYYAAFLKCLFEAHERFGIEKKEKGYPLATVFKVKVF
jgi:hypothetical protein